MTVLIRIPVLAFTAPFLLLASGFAAAQAPTPLSRQLARMDLGVSGAGIFNKSVSGAVTPLASNTGQTLSIATSNTFGALVTLRYVAKPYLGFEGNYSYARYTEKFSGPGVAPFGVSVFEVQTQANEFSFGYLVTPPHPVFGMQPFASVGAGSMEFKPTPHGGQNEPKQARAAYYYTVGLQKDYNAHIGFRATFRQSLFLAPDFGQNYLTIKQRTLSTQPAVGVYLRF